MSFEQWWNDPEHSLATDCPSDKWIAEKAYEAGVMDTLKAYTTEQEEP